MKGAYELPVDMMKGIAGAGCYAFSFSESLGNGYLYLAK